MRFAPLALIACFAPFPVAAFGDLDCISIESCTDGQCVASTDTFSITFDWTNGAAIVQLGAEVLTLPLSEGTEGTGDIPDTDLAFGDILGGKSGLLVVAESPDDIVAYFAQSADVMTVYTGFCDIKEAA